MNSSEALHDIYGHGKKLKKAFFYRSFAAVKELSNTHNATDKSIHGRKRRVLSQAFSDTAMKGLEGIMLEKIRQFCDAVSPSNKEKSGPTDFAEWFSYLTFDVMGALCFGKGFDMILGGSQRRVIKLIDRAAFRHYVVSANLIISRAT
jgi:cytochrome P450